jgi:hypothetical protein
VNVKIAVATGLVLALVALGSAALPGAAQAQTNVCQTNPSPPDAADPDITVTSPTSGATITSPVTVTGQARTFESTVQVSLFDADGDEIASTFGTANAPDVGQHGPYSISLTFSVSADADACLWVYEDSAATGDPINVVQVPVRLDVAGLPSTGTGGPGATEQEGAPAVLLALLAVLGAGSVAGAVFLRRAR